MKKTFRYILSVVAAVLLGAAFSACTNEDNVDLGAVGNWSVECSKVTAPGLSEERIKQLVEDFTAVANQHSDLSLLEEKNETQAKYYLDYAAETCYQYLNDETNQAVRDELKNGSTITYTLYRVTKPATETEPANRLVSNTAVLTIYSDDITITNN